MATNSQYSTAARNAAADAIAALCNTGYLRLYDGSQPANANTAITSQTMLAELRFASTAFGAAASGIATAAAIASVAAAASGTVTWFRALKSDGTSVVFDGSVGTATANLIMNAVAISSGATVAISSLTLTAAAAGT